MSNAVLSNILICMIPVGVSLTGYIVMDIGGMIKYSEKFTDLFSIKKWKEYKFSQLTVDKQIKRYNNFKDINQKLDVLKKMNDLYYPTFAPYLQTKEEIDLVMNLLKYDFDKKCFLSKINDDEEKYLYLINNRTLQIYANEIVPQFKNKELIFKYIMDTIDEYVKYDVTKKCHLSDEQLFEIINSMYSVEYKNELVCLYNDDKYKLDYLNNNNIFRNRLVDIVLSLKDKNNRNKCAKQFCISRKEMLVGELLHTKDPNEQKKIVKKLNDKSLLEVVDSNESNNYNNIMENVKLEKDAPLTSQDITIGVELESSNLNNKLYEAIGKILNRWSIKFDESINHSVEIVSPILHFNSKDLKELKYVCDFMENNKFIITDDCGGHIHIGLDFFKTKEELEMLYYLFGNCEYIFYLILNKNMTIPRDNVEKYAKSISPLLNSNENYIESSVDYSDLIKKLKAIQDERRYSVNILNAGKINKNTIEFRLPNGEFNYNEVVKNIYLLVSLVSKSKELSHIDKKDPRVNKIIALGNELDNNKKIQILLDLLFSNEEDKKIYMDRFNSNNKLLNTLSNPSLKRIPFSSVKVDNLEKKLIINKKH